MCNARAWPKQCWKSCADGSNNVALRFGDHGTNEMLGVVGSKVWTNSNFAHQHTATGKRVCKRTQHVTSNNVGSCWLRMLLPFSLGLSVVEWTPANPPPVNITTLFSKAPSKNRQEKVFEPNDFLAQCDTNSWFPQYEHFRVFMPKQVPLYYLILLSVQYNHRACQTWVLFSLLCTSL